MVIVAGRALDWARQKGAGRATLEKLSEASKQYHAGQLARANQWWSRWRMEVQSLQRSVEALSKAWAKTVTMNHKAEWLNRS